MSASNLDTGMTPDLDRLRDLTERYARYSRSAGGLSLVIGGMLLVVTFAIGALVPLTPGLRWALASAPLAWLLAKELMRALYYQRSGGASQQVAPALRRQRRWMVGYLTLISAFIVAAVFYFAGARAFEGQALGYLLLVAALPLVALRWFWSVGDFLVGVLLICQAAVVFAGGHYTLAWLAYATLCAAIAIATGLREHREFLRVRAELGRLAMA